jgi:hypothetical protein
MTLHSEVDNWRTAILDGGVIESDRVAPDREGTASSTVPEQFTKRPTQYMTATWGS